MEGNRNEEQEKGAEIRAILSFRDRSYKDLEDIQAESLLKLDQPLQKVYERLDSKETGYMDSVWETIEECASTEKSRSGSAGYEKENR